MAIILKVYFIIIEIDIVLINLCPMYTYGSRRQSLKH